LGENQANVKQFTYIFIFSSFSTEEDRLRRLNAAAAAKTRPEFSTNSESNSSYI